MKYYAEATFLFALGLLDEAYCSGKGLLKYCAQQILHLASVSSADDLRPSKAKLYLPLYLIVRPAMILTSHSNNRIFRNQHLTHALRSLPITIAERVDFGIPRWRNGYSSTSSMRQIHQVLRAGDDG
jgi:hypothetical protein